MSAQQSTCKARALRAASHPGSTITSRQKNKEIHRYCPGVSLHVTPHPVFKNLTIPGAYHIVSCMERESISLTCATLDFPAKYSWNLKTSLRCFHEICQQIKVLVYKKMEKALVKLEHRSSTWVTSWDWHGASGNAGATSSSAGVWCTRSWVSREFSLALLGAAFIYTYAPPHQLTSDWASNYKRSGQLKL